MVPSTYNFPKQYQGDTFDAVQFTFKNADTKAGIDLTGATIRCQFRGPFNPKNIKEISLGSGITMVNATAGVISLDPFVITWAAGTYKYDIEITFPGGEIKTYVKGNIVVVGDTTN